MLRLLKRTALYSARKAGVFEAIARSKWRLDRLVILCYHGLSLKDEHQWAEMYVTPEFFRRRMQILARLGYRVLGLDEALTMLRQGTLPPKAVVITFDDGFYDFLHFGLPTLREFGYPATVYQTSYYSAYPYPIYNLVLSYLFWRGTGRRFVGDPYGVPGTFELSPATNRRAIVRAFLDAARRNGYGEAQRNDVAAAVAADLGVDYSEILRLRMLQLMTSAEVAVIANGGIDVQLHTHRHRTPLDEQLFVREVRDNRNWLAGITSADARHFCYPSGQHRSEFLPWLRAEGIVSATTCNRGIATRSSEPLLLPRYLDSMLVPDAEFEGWLCGLSSLLPHKRG